MTQQATFLSNGWYVHVSKPAEYEIEDLPSLGWLQITDIGEENIYFTWENGTQGFCKVLR